MKTALVTGGNRGIGKEVVKALASKGIHVLLGCRDLDKGQDAARKMKGEVTPVPLDLTDAVGLSQQLDTLCVDHPVIDVLVNNAAVLHRGTALQVTAEQFMESMQVNALAAFQLTHHLMPGMLNRGYGRIVNVTSGWGCVSDGLTGPTAYSVSKCALNALTISFAQSASGNVKVNAACPGWVRTKMGGITAPRSAAKGAETIVWLATLEDNGPNGSLYRDKKPIAW